ncbi:RNA polymerase II-associated protein 1 N-terminal [Penicillium angulare]|uniref:RNA polymerase II-associated protein 1 N-terminal n=1 Tax=Penicillium angulare TaxID=116970 RepID=UPI002542091B|nr:RNA polymerase II-associated protein 1 N-terminal [Penicillium angulare]KAJ5288514.1 RNA polymerase II-associated protein 1 N-terminal [Penicillium angulare]
MAFQGERFVLDLDDDEGGPQENPAPSPFSLIGEIRERAPAPAKPPAPTPTASSTGFPAHRRRNKPSSFKQRRAEQPAETSPPPPPQPPTDPTEKPTAQDDKNTISEQNRQQLSSMSDAQIEREREELMSSMDPGLLERFLRRAKIDDAGEFNHEEPKPSSTSKSTSTSTAEPASTNPAPPSKPKKSVSFATPAPDKKPAPKKLSARAPNPIISEKPSINDDLPPSEIPKDLHPASEAPSLDPAMLEAFHFPQPKQPMPTLDPNDPNFLSDMQSHYFPEMSHDPTGLSWMKPAPAEEEDPEAASPYHPASNADGITPSEIRFSLRGELIAPNTSLSLPTTLGLHHHGDDPHAAGYTIPELAILSRSTFPAQRCVAWQVIGRILFRLGRAEFGDRGGQLSDGLWFVIEKEGVVGRMLAEAEGAAGQFPVKGPQSGENKKEGAKDDLPAASGIGRHASAAAWAVEGVWLWQRGGGGDRGLLKEGQVRSN